MPCLITMGYPDFWNPKIHDMLRKTHENNFFWGHWEAYATFRIGKWHVNRVFFFCDCVFDFRDDILMVQTLSPKDNVRGKWKSGGVNMASFQNPQPQPNGWMCKWLVGFIILNRTHLDYLYGTIMNYIYIYICIRIILCVRMYICVYIRYNVNMIICRNYLHDDTYIYIL